ncbi:MAG TPA: chromosomal replication initiator protein DnaA [Candidatus Limnocylindria bacterium]|nr:chromosomal replication initiator protein DnaA [Candidatus Limnocylindria bacterium]
MALQPPQLEATHRIWEQVLSSVQSRLESAQTFETWFRPILPLSLCTELVELEVPNLFFIDWLHEHHLPALKRALAEVLGSEPEIRFMPRNSHANHVVASLPVNDLDAAPPASTPASTPPRRADRTWLEGHLHPRLTFESFVVGGSNRLTQAACQAVAKSPGKAYNPLFIFGGSGLGKTHLLHAVGHAVRRSRPEARVCYVPAERFTNELIYAIQHNQTLAFRNRYRGVDLLLIDDVQFIAGKESTQEEFFYTFNALRDAHKQVVATADKPPKDILQIEERLTSRFNQGLVTDIQQPDLETRLAILKNRYELEGANLRLPEDVLLLIADRIRNNIRDLEGCLVRVLALSSLLHQEITVDLAEEVLQHYVNPEPERLTPERILATVAERYGVKVEALCGARRTQSVALPRQVAMYLMRQLTDLSLLEIGRVFGGRDHTTVMYACTKMRGLFGSDKAFAERVNGLISTLESA